MPHLSTFNELPLRLLTALLLAGLVAMLAYRAHALTTTGAIAATLVGGTIVGGAGWWCGCLLVLFFATSTVLSKYRTARATNTRQHPGSERDAVQVLANGGGPAFLAFVSGVTGSGAILVGIVAAIAAATADTWATEIGRLTQATARSITTGKCVPVGTSGAVSIPGALASILGSTLIATPAAIGFTNGWIDGELSTPGLLVLIAIAGTFGSFLDSLLGATVQESFFCPLCNATTESTEHAAKHGATRVRGLPRFNNDAVNLSSIVITAMVAWVCVSILD